MIIISWEQLLLGLEVNVDSIPVLYHSYINKLVIVFKIFRVKGFCGLIVHKFFTDEIFPDYNMMFVRPLRYGLTDCQIKE